MPYWAWLIPLAAIVLLFAALVLPVGAVTLGLEAKDMVLLLLTFLVSSITLVSGRTHVMQAVVHRVIFCAFLFLAFVP